MTSSQAFHALTTVAAEPMDTSAGEAPVDRSPLRFDPADPDTAPKGVDSLHWDTLQVRRMRIAESAEAWTKFAATAVGESGSYAFAPDVEHTGPLGQIKSIGICVAHVGDSDGKSAAPMTVLLKTRFNIDLGTDFKIDEICEREFWRKDNNWQTWLALGDYALPPKEAAHLYRYVVDLFYARFPKKRAVIINDNPSDDLGRIDALLRQFQLRPTRYSPLYQTAGAGAAGNYTYDYRALKNPYDLLQGICNVALRGKLEVDGKTVGLPTFAAHRFGIQFEHKFAHSHMPDDDAAHMIEAYAVYVGICARAEQAGMKFGASLEKLGTAIKATRVATAAAVAATKTAVAAREKAGVSSAAAAAAVAAAAAAAKPAQAESKVPLSAQKRPPLLASSETTFVQGENVHAGQRFAEAPILSAQDRRDFYVTGPHPVDTPSLFAAIGAPSYYVVCERHEPAPIRVDCTFADQVARVYEAEAYAARRAAQQHVPKSEF